MNFSALEKEFEGEFYTDETTRRLYATDASAYREVPVAVAVPKNEKDIERLIRFANENNAEAGVDHPALILQPGR
jgi:FAD/FMN-containing dehydrogenase